MCIHGMWGRGQREERRGEVGAQKWGMGRGVGTYRVLHRWCDLFDISRIDACVYVYAIYIYIYMYIAMRFVFVAMWCVVVAVRSVWQFQDWYLHICVHVNHGHYRDWYHFTSNFTISNTCTNTENEGTHSFTHQYIHTTDRGDRTWNNFDCQNLNKFHGSPRNFHTIFHGNSQNFKQGFMEEDWSPRHSKEQTGKLSNLEIQIL